MADMSPATRRLGAEPTLPRGSELRDYLRILERRKVIALSVFCMSVLVGVLCIRFSPPLYEATISVLIKAEQNPQSETLLSKESALGRAASSTNLATEVQIMRSQNIASDALKYLDDPTIVELIRSLDIKVPGGTDIAEIRATSTDPKAARDYAQAIARAYEAYTLERNRREAQRAIDFVKKRLTEVGVDLTEAENQLEEFKRAHEITTASEAASRMAGTITQLETELRAATAEQASSAAREAALKQQLSGEPRQVTVETSETNPVLQQLEQELTKLEAQRVELLARYSPTSRRVGDAERQITAIRDRMAREEQKRVTEEVRQANPVHQETTQGYATARATTRAASARVGAVAAALGEARQQLRQMPAVEVQFARLDRNLQVQEETYRTLLSTLQSLEITRESETPGADIISREDLPPPRHPIAPDPRRILLISIGVGVVLALLSALLAEYVDDKFRAMESIEEETHLPLLGGLLKQDGLDAALRSLALETERQGLGQAADLIWSNIQFCGEGTPVRTLLVSSAGAQDGKTTLTTVIGIGAARAGKRALLVDADLHRPGLSRALGVAGEVGLSNVLAGGMPAESVIQATSSANLSVLAAGPRPPNPVQLLSSEIMRELVGRLAASHDVVVIDAPPLLLLPDPQILSSMVDGALLVVRMGATTRGGMRRAMALVERAGGRVLGVLANWITHRARDYYYYYYYHYYDHYYRDEGRDT